MPVIFIPIIRLPPSGADLPTGNTLLNREARKGSLSFAAILASLISVIGIINFIGSVQKAIATAGQPQTGSIQLHKDHVTEAWIFHISAFLFICFFVFVAVEAVRQLRLLNEPEPSLPVDHEREEESDRAVSGYQRHAHSADAKWERNQPSPALPPSPLPKPDPVGAIPLEEITLNELPINTRR